jgi:hypothetical protein
MATFLKSPSVKNARPGWTLAGFHRLASSVENWGMSWPWWTMGPATRWGKKVTNRT